MSASAASLVSGREPANSRDAMQPGMWVILLEIGLVIGLAAFIVWWTWPKKRDGEGVDAEREDSDAER
jgi:hypothetical protein